VATQSLAAVAAVLGHDRDREFLSAAAVGMWGIGVMLYLMLATLITLRLLTTPNEARTFNPSYWIYMGATAITVLAGSRILGLPKDLPIMSRASAFVSGFTYVLWAFGTWWIPLLVIFGIWRHFSRGEPNVFNCQHAFRSRNGNAFYRDHWALGHLACRCCLADGDCFDAIPRIALV
jgi:tellurite resistance protein TehA-like permease